jgi:hypothetical protein
MPRSCLGHRPRRGVGRPKRSNATDLAAPVLDSCPTIVAFAQSRPLDRSPIWRRLVTLEITRAMQGIETESPNRV